MMIILHLIQIIGGSFLIAGIIGGVTMIGISFYQSIGVKRTAEEIQKKSDEERKLIKGAKGYIIAIWILVVFSVVTYLIWK